MTVKQDETLEKLKRGILRFEDEVYPSRKEHYLYAASNPQKPHTLLITCADSRVDPEALTSSAPGSIFVTRNVGNMVPAYGNMLGGVSAVIEYAVDALKVKHAVVCGHTDCGAMKGLIAGKGALDDLPTVKHWLENADAAKRVASSVDGAETPTLPTMTEQNVLLQLQHLRTHPSVAGAIARGELTLSGWVYDIGHGNVRIYDESKKRFVPVRETATAEVFRLIVPHSPQLRRLLEYVGMPLLLLFLWDGVIVLLYKVAHWDWLGLPHIPLALFGSSIGLIVAFRNNSSYGRWWEARTLWGGIVNNSRSWARQVLTSIAAQKLDEKEDVRKLQCRMVYLQIAWVHALRQQLRGQPPLDELHGILGEDDLVLLKDQKNVAFTLQLWQSDLAREALEKEWVDSLQWSALDDTLNDLIDLQGGSERIKNTPMPKQYDFYPQLFVRIYCLLLPLALVQNMGWLTPLGSTLVGFIFIALDKIGRDLENPFDNTIYDIPLTSMSRTIEINLRQAMGERSLPAPAEPVRGVLW